MILLVSLLLLAPADDAIKALKQEERELLDSLDDIIEQRRGLEKQARDAERALTDLSAKLAAQQAQLAIEEKAVSRARVDARARLRQLDKLLRGQALRFIVGAESFSEGIRRARVVERSVRRDAKMLTRVTRVFEMRERKAKDIADKSQQAQALLGTIEGYKRGIAEASRALQATLLAVRERRSIEERTYYDLREFEATLQKETEEDKIAAADVFVKQRGSLPWPVARQFTQASADPRVVRFSCPAGEAVSAVAAGVVEFASELDGYGVVVIIKHSDNYYGVYSGLAAAGVKSADTVQASARLGTSAGAGVGFELRRRTAVEEAQKWLAR
jgi:septal ring factor EnvC (AmiA/AmiB activator)